MTYFDLQPEEVTPKVVGIVGFDGVAALDLTGPLDALARASLAGASNKRSVCYRPVILGLASKRFVSESGLPFKAEATLATVSLEGVPLITSYTRSALTGWTVAGGIAENRHPPGRGPERRR